MSSAKEPKKKPLMQFNHREKFTSYDKFIKRYPENPVMAIFDSADQSELVDKGTAGPHIRILTLHVDYPEGEMVVVEMPDGPEIRAYADKYYVPGPDEL